VSTKVNLRPRPEEDELRLKGLELEDIEKELVEKELQLTGLRAEAAYFERLYLRTVGVLYAELDDIEARIAELNACRNPSNADAQDLRPGRRELQHIVARAGDEQRRLVDDDAAPRCQELPRTRDIAVPVQAAAKTGPPKLGRVIVKVCIRQPRRQRRRIHRVVQQAHAWPQPTESRALRSITN
jgi:hypothetical protein